jgi:hypothetical protein
MPAGGHRASLLATGVTGLAVSLIGTGFDYMDVGSQRFDTAAFRVALVWCSDKKVLDWRFTCICVGGAMAMAPSPQPIINTLLVTRCSGAT